MQRVHWDPAFATRVRQPDAPSTTAACARRGSSISAPTGWATTRGCGSSTASSAGSTTSATRNGCAGRVVRKYLAAGDRPGRRPRARRGQPARRGRRRPATRRSCLPSREHGPVRLPDPPGGATDLQIGACRDLRGVPTDDARRSLSRRPGRADAAARPARRSATRSTTR